MWPGRRHAPGGPSMPAEDTAGSRFGPFGGRSGGALAHPFGRPESSQTRTADTRAGPARETDRNGLNLHPFTQRYGRIESVPTHDAAEPPRPSGRNRRGRPARSGPRVAADSNRGYPCSASTRNGQEPSESAAVYAAIWPDRVRGDSRPARGARAPPAQTPSQWLFDSSSLRCSWMIFSARCDGTSS